MANLDLMEADTKDVLKAAKKIYRQISRLKRQDYTIGSGIDDLCDNDGRAMKETDEDLISKAKSKQNLIRIEVGKLRRKFLETLINDNE